jgi:dethiobiotin synthetase
METIMRKIVVAGIGTDVGKTIVSSILTDALDANYWKPVQCGLCHDRETIETFLGKDRTFPETVYLKAPRSPHHAAELEGVSIDPAQIIPPQTERTLIIEGCGGILVPLTLQTLTIDLFASWGCEWVIVSRHYIGSINHSLLTLEALKRRSLNIKGIIFNGHPCPQTESAILKFSNLPCIARLQQEPQWNLKTIHAYAKQWTGQKAFQSAILK